VLLFIEKKKYVNGRNSIEKIIDTKKFSPFMNLRKKTLLAAGLHTKIIFEEVV